MRSRNLPEPGTGLVAKTLDEDIVGGVIVGNWVPLSADIVTDEREEVGHDVKLSTNVLRCDATAVLNQAGR